MTPNLWSPAQWTAACLVLLVLALLWHIHRQGRCNDDLAWRVRVLEHRLGITRPDPPGRAARARVALHDWAAIVRHHTRRRPATGRHRHQEDTTDAPTR